MDYHYISFMECRPRDPLEFFLKHKGNNSALFMILFSCSVFLTFLSLDASLNYLDQASKSDSKETKVK